MEKIRSIQNMKQFFIKNGKKNVIESQFIQFFKEKSLNGSTNVTHLLEKSLNNGTSYVFLKTRRRGKRIKHKVSYLEEAKGEKRALLMFSKLFKEKRSNTESFSVKLDKELNVLSTDKNILITKRDELHKIALENSPTT